jgi:hypothetical protein
MPYRGRISWAYSIRFGKTLCLLSLNHHPLSTSGVKMGKLVKEDSEKGRLHIDTPLMGESLVSKDLLKRTEATEYFRMHPDINVLKIGGQSIMDRGGTAIFPFSTPWSRPRKSTKYCS